MAIPVGDFILAPGENYQQCPYNLAHVITNARLIVHLDKCRRNYLKMMKESGKKTEMKQCKFNYTHHVPAPEIDFHESRCQDQYHVVESLRYHQSDEFKATLVEEQKRKLEAEKESEIHRKAHDSSHKDKKSSKKHKDVKPQVQESPWGDDAEDWEADSNGYEPGYDPAGKLQSEIVLFHPRGLSKSERKTFRSDQRQRAADIDNASMSTASPFDVKPKLEVKEPKTTSGPSKAASVSQVVRANPVDLPEYKEDGEISEEEFYGEDPYST